MTVPASCTLGEHLLGRLCARALALGVLNAFFAASFICVSWLYSNWCLAGTHTVAVRGRHVCVFYIQVCQCMPHPVCFANFAKRKKGGDSSVRTTHKAQYGGHGDGGGGVLRVGTGELAS